MSIFDSRQIVTNIPAETMLIMALFRLLNGISSVSSDARIPIKPRLGLCYFATERRNAKYNRLLEIEAERRTKSHFGHSYGEPLETSYGEDIYREIFPVEAENRV